VDLAFVLRVAVLGGGLQGACVAMELASCSVALVIEIDADAMCG
jgi:uncharacterized NAD(P)/FAD-binding protein YdhS